MLTPTAQRSSRLLEPHARKKSARDPKTGIDFGFLTCRRRSTPNPTRQLRALTALSLSARRVFFPLKHGRSARADSACEIGFDLTSVHDRSIADVLQDACGADRFHPLIHINAGQQRCGHHDLIGRHELRRADGRSSRRSAKERPSLGRNGHDFPMDGARHVSRTR